MHILITAISAAQTRDLRSRILRPRQLPETLIYDGDDEQDTFHIGAFCNGQLSGIGSVMRRNPAGDPSPDNWLLRGMATTPETRGSGLGKAILNEAIRYCRERDGALLWCNARTSAADFYQKSGFVIEGEEFELPDIGPHFLMIKTL